MGIKYVAAGPKLEFSDTKFLTPNLKQLKQLKQLFFLINAWNKQIGIKDVFFDLWKIKTMIVKCFAELSSWGCEVALQDIFFLLDSETRRWN